MSASFFAEQASMTVAKFWVAVDDLLRAEGARNASWEEELVDLYVGGMPVPKAFNTVLKRRGVR